MGLTATNSSVAPCVTEVLEGRLYLGNLQVALSAEQQETLSITHIVSVCPEYPSTGCHHLSIPVQDTEYDDLLTHLPKACSFIEDALSQGGRVLVHCVMGISRSATVVAAFLMKTQNLTSSAAIKHLKHIRPQVHPNYGFIKQLGVFSKCGFNNTPYHSEYKSWKRRHIQDVTHFLNHIEDTVSIIPNKLLLSSDFPSDPELAQSFLLDIGITHLISLSPAEIPSATTLVSKHRHINLDCRSPEALLLALPAIVANIRDVLRDEGNVVLLHSVTESRACIAASAYLMASQRMPPARAAAVIQDAHPLFNPTRSFYSHLEAFQACAYAPTTSSAAVRDFQKAPENKGKTTVPARRGPSRRSFLEEVQFDLHALGDALMIKPVHVYPYAMRPSVTS